MNILDLLRTECRAKLIPEKYAEKIQKLFNIEKEEGIGNYVSMFKDNIMPDLEASESAADKAVEEYEKKYNIKEGKTIESPQPPTPAVDMTKLSPELQAIFTAQSKQIETLTNLVSNVVTTQSKSQKLETVRAAMKGKIDDEFLEDFVNRANLDAEDVNKEVETLVKDFTTMKQKFITKAVSDGSYVPASGSGATDADFTEFIASKKEDAVDEFAGKKV